MTAAAAQVASLQKPEIELPDVVYQARPADVIDAALLRAPGLDALTEEQAETLRTALVDGMCIADALKATTGRANPFTVRALRRIVGTCEAVN